MKVLVYEYITGGGNDVVQSDALASEGAIMLAALTEDLASIPGVSVNVLWDSRAPQPASSHPDINWLRVGPNEQIRERLLQELHGVDAAWLIAPETGGVLEALCQLVESAGKVLLTSPAGAVRITASKLETARRLGHRDIPVVPTVTWDVHAASPPWPLPVVIKADDGVGCESTHIIRTSTQWDDFRLDHTNRDWIMQPLAKGESLSLSALFAEDEALLLSINRQHIRESGNGFALSGCSVNAIPDTDGRFAALLKRIAAAIPELWGYVGIDLMRDGEHLRVLEINPRLTSSYAGLNAALGMNPAGLVLALQAKGRLPDQPMIPLNPVDVMFAVDQ
jgi:tyramine---L-glutamate ligase